MSAELPTPPVKTIDDGVSADSMTNRTVITYGTGKGGYEMAFKDKITPNGVDYSVDNYKLVDKSDNDRDVSGEFTIDWDRKTDTVTAVRTADKGEMPWTTSTSSASTSPSASRRTSRRSRTTRPGRWNQEPEADAGSKEFDTWQPNPDKSWIVKGRQMAGRHRPAGDQQDRRRPHTYLDGDKVGSVVNGTVGRNLIQEPSKLTLTDNWTAADYISTPTPRTSA